MRANQNRYRAMERFMTCTLCVDVLLFILYLISSGSGISWLRTVLTILCIVLSCGILIFLYLSQELTKRRSLWISTGAVAVMICLLFSLILNFPSPKPY